MLSWEQQEHKETPVRTGDDLNRRRGPILGSAVPKLGGTGLFRVCGAVVAGIPPRRAAEHPAAIGQLATVPVYLRQLSFLI
ncbi:MAG: hypothetical protein ACHQ9S_24180 [Candidatus Binatia bacterium]